jgi:hypothetical protein
MACFSERQMVIFQRHLASAFSGTPKKKAAHFSEAFASMLVEAPFFQAVVDSRADMISHFFSLPNPTSSTMALVFTQPLTVMSIRKHFWG